jgi:hypothetical protein
VSHLLLHATARARNFLVRHRSIYWVLVGSIAAGAGGLVASEVAAAREARAAWTDTRPVVISCRAIAAGSMISEADITTAQLPVGAVPTVAITTLAVGTQARDDIAAGEVLLSTHLGAVPAGELRPATRGVAIPRVAGSLPLMVGTVVDLIAVDDPLAVTGGPGGLIAANATVIVVTDEVAVVAVSESAAPAVAGAAATGRITMIWRSGPLASAPGGESGV